MRKGRCRAQFRARAITPALFSPVDQVAQQHHTCPRRPPREIIGLDPRDQLLEQVQASVNIPHGIDPLPFGNMGPRQPDASRKTGI
jgi:hypothetical protein